MPATFYDGLLLSKGTSATPSLSFITSLGATGFWLDETGSVPAIVAQTGGSTRMRLNATGLTITGVTETSNVLKVSPSAAPANLLQVGPSFMATGISWINQALRLGGPLYIHNITDQVKHHGLVSSDDGNLTLLGVSGQSAVFSAQRYISTVGTGTAPLGITSTTEVTNLNAQLWQGRQIRTACALSGGGFEIGGIYWDGSQWANVNASGKFGWTFRHGDAAGVSATAGGLFQILMGQTASTGVGSTAAPVTIFSFDKNGTFTAPILASNVATGTAPFTITSTTEVTNLNVQLLGGTSRRVLQTALRSNVVVTGGGTVTVSSSMELAWTARFIVIANGRGSWFGTAGFFDIALPTVGSTITGVGGASNQTVTSGGIPLTNGVNGWVALYYILPLGSSSSSVPGNLRLVSYTADFEVPEHWILLAQRNGENGLVKLANGTSLRAGESLDTTTWSSVRLGSQPASYYLSLHNQFLGMAFSLQSTGAPAVRATDQHLLGVVGDAFAFRTVSDVEYWDFTGSAWTAATTGQVNPQVLLTGKIGFGVNTVAATYRKFRFVVSTSTFLGQVMLGVHQIWNQGAHQLALTLERGPTASGAWTTMIAETLSNAGELNYHVYAASNTAHNGDGFYRVTVESKDAVNSTSYTGIQLLCSYTRDATLTGGPVLPFTWDHTRKTTFTVAPFVGANTIWHAGNDGTGSGLDADRLDGYHASNFLDTSTTSQVKAGALYFRNGSGAALVGIGPLDAGNTGNAATLNLYTGGGAGANHWHIVARGDSHATTPNELNLYLYGGADPGSVLRGRVDRVVVFDKTPLVGANTIWHAGNDGASSGLDADLLDGNHASAFALASHTHAWTDINSGKPTTLGGYGITDAYTKTESDGRYEPLFSKGSLIQGTGITLSGTLTNRLVGSGDVTITATGVTDHGSLTGLADDDHTQYHTDARGDARYLRLIGGTLTGSLTLRSGTSSMVVAVGPSDTGNTSNAATLNLYTGGGGSNYWHIVARGDSHVSEANYMAFYLFGGGDPGLVAQFRSDRVVSFAKTPLVGANTIWHAGNDGTGSTLDADLLDGYHATAFALSSHVHAWTDINSGKPTTLGGYGITDAYTKTESDGRYLLLSGGTVTGGLALSGLGSDYSTASASNRILVLDPSNNVRKSGPDFVRGMIDAAASNHSHPISQITMNTARLLGRYSAGTGVVQEIVISTGLSLDGSGNLTATGAGSVTSVGLSAPSFLTVSNSPVTSSGTLTLTLASQTANQVFAAPNGSNGAPGFRALVAADIPSLSYLSTTSGGTVSGSVTFSSTLTFSGLGADLSSGAGQKVLMRADSGYLVRAITLTGLKGYLDYQIGDITGLQAALDAKVPTSRTVTGTLSITGGGDLSANRTLSLVGDENTPGNFEYYGTDGTGAKGYHALPMVKPTGGATNEVFVLVCTNGASQTYAWYRLVGDGVEIS